MKYLIVISGALLAGSACHGRQAVVLDSHTNHNRDQGVAVGADAMPGDSTRAADQHPPSSSWASSPGSSGTMTGTAFALDKAGNIYVTGYFRGTATFAGQKHTSRGQRDVMLLKLAPSGKELWALPMGGSGDDHGQGVAVDSAGDVHVTGSFSKQARFGHATLTGASNSIFLIRVSAAGKVQWAWSSGSVGGVGLDVATGPGGLVVLAGTGNYGMVAVGFSHGKISWTVSGGVGTWGVVESVAINAAGHICLAGTFGPGTLKMGSSPLKAALSKDDFVARLTTKGEVLWTASLPPEKVSSGYYQQAKGVATVPGGGCVVAGVQGKEANTWTWGYRHPFVARMTAAGKLDWVVSPSTEATLSGLAVDADGSAFVSGYAASSLDFSGGRYKPTGKYDLYMARVSPKGVLDWATGVGDTGLGPAAEVAVSGKHLLLLGSFGGKAVTMAGVTLTSRDHDNMLLWRTNKP